jgi:O-antigen ligase
VNNILHRVFKTHFQHGLFYFIATVLVVSPLVRFSWDIPAQIVCAVALAICFLLTIVSQNIDVSLENEGLELLFLMCCGVSAIGVFHVPAVRSAVLVVFNAAVLVYLIRFVRIDDRKKFGLVIIVTGIVLSIAVGAFRLWPRTYLPIIVNPNICAGYIIMCYLLAVAEADNKSYRGVAIVLLVGLFLTKSRAAVSIGLLCTIIYWAKAVKSPARVAIGGMVALGCLIMFLNGRGDVSIINRIVWWNSAWRMFIAHPMKGVGWGNFGNTYLSLRSTVSENTIYAHNIILQVLAESGIIGMCGGVGFMLWRLKKMSLRSPHVLAITGFLLYNLFDYSFYIPSHMFAFFVLLYSADRAPDHDTHVPHVTLNAVGKTVVIAVFVVCSIFLMTNDSSLAMRYSAQAEILFKKYTVSKDLLNLAQAIDQQEHAVLAAPQTASLHSDLAWLYWVGGQKKAARKEILEAIRRDPLNIGYQKTLRQFMLQK